MNVVKIGLGYGESVMYKRIQCFILSLFCLISLTFAEETIEPVIKEKLQGTETCVFIKTDVPAVEVYINGIFQGTTDLEICDVLPGLYNLDLVKSGYEKYSCVISVKSGYSLEYSFIMEKVYGELSVLNVPNEALVTVGSSVSSSKTSSDKDFVDYVLKVEPGEYELKIEKFGYEKYSEWIQIEANKTTEISVDLEESPFVLSNFACNKTSFNPDYSGHLGCCTCSFSVTAHGTAKVIITDDAGREVWSKQFLHFTSWGQTFDWNGRDSSNNKLPDGIYCISITADGAFEKVYVSLDSTISYPLVSANKTGAGIGNVPVILTEKKNIIMPYLQGGIVKSENGTSSMYGVLSAGFLSDFANHFELNVLGTAFPGLEGSNRIDLAAAFKIYGCTPITIGTICYGGEIGYKYQNGHLLDAGAIFGVDFSKLYAGVSYEYSVYPDSMGKLGLAFAYKPVKAFRIGVWGLLLENYEIGVDVSYMPDSSAFIINAKSGVEIKEKPVVTVTFGLSYLL